jgi:malonate transporter
MFEIFSLVIPFFAVIGCGYVGAKLIGEEGQQGLNLFVVYFALPALLFSLMARGELATYFEGNFVAAYTSTSVVLVIFAFIIFRGLYHRHRPETAILAMGAVYGNIGYMGIPVITLILGPKASVPAIIALIIDVMIIVPLMSTIIVSGSENRTRNVFRAATDSFIATSKSPFIVAAFLGAAWSFTGLSLPNMADGFLDILATAAAPCALFALGSSLYGKPIGANISPALAVSFFKLVIHPIALYVSLTMIFSVDPEWAKPAVIAASLPVALTVYIVARQYNTLVVGASTAILLSTALSLVTVPLTLLVLGKLF